MRTAAGETEAQRALRDCSKAVVGESQHIRFWWREFNAIECLLYKRFSASHKELMSPWRDLVPFYRRRDARIGILKSVTEFRACLKTNLSKDLFDQFPLSTEVPHSPPSGSAEGWQLQPGSVEQDSIYTEADGKCPCCIQPLANFLGKCQFVVDTGILAW